ncbi:MAG: sulfite exporter TauE/SafE family protein [Gammaproteobacteria bacterium]
MDPLFTVLGFLVGAVVGFTGVGGGSLMTPLLLMLGVSPATAVGTDLLYAALTKCGAVWVHGRQRTVAWSVVGRMALGSIPAALLAVLLLRGRMGEGGELERIVVATLSVSLVLTALVLLARERIGAVATAGGPFSRWRERWRGPATVVAGALIGVLVALSSVGAGALGAAVLVVLYPGLRAVHVVGTDLAHAVPLAAVAGLGHLHLGTVDGALLASLLAGSLPGIYLGTRIGGRLPERYMRRALGCVLLTVGVGLGLGG